MYKGVVYGIMCKNGSNCTVTIAVLSVDLEANICNKYHITYSVYAMIYLRVVSNDSTCYKHLRLINLGCNAYTAELPLSRNSIARKGEIASSGK